MFIVCEKCKKVLVDGKWVVAVPPIGQVKYSVCTECEPSQASSHTMVYMDKQRKDNPPARK